MPVNLAIWQNFFILMGTAAATLAGLLFIGITFSTGAFKGDVSKAIRVWADPTYFHFVQVLMVSALSLMPALPPVVLGCLLIAYVIWRCVRLWEVHSYFSGPDAPDDIELTDWMELVILPGTAHLLLLVSALGFMFGWLWSPYGLAAFCMLLLFVGMANSWSQISWVAITISKAKARGKKR